MDAGRELDALVAEKVMGLEVKPYEKLKGSDIPEYFGTLWVPSADQNRGTPYQQWLPLPHYSTSIAAAWEVVEKLKDDDFHLEEHGTHWKAGFGPRWRGAETAPHAICLAALEAIGAL